MGMIKEAVTSFMSTRRKLEPSKSTDSRGVAVKSVSHGDEIDEPATKVVILDVDSDAVSKQQIDDGNPQPNKDGNKFDSDTSTYHDEPESDDENFSADELEILAHLVQSSAEDDATYRITLLTLP